MNTWPAIASHARFSTRHGGDAPLCRQRAHLELIRSLLIEIEEEFGFTGYTSRAFQQVLRFLGFESSLSYVATPERNGVVGRFFLAL